MCVGGVGVGVGVGEWGGGVGVGGSGKWEGWELRVLAPTLG
jgi:hypothetical protein